MNNVLCMTFQNIALGLTGWPVLANALRLEKFEKARHIGGDTLNWQSHNWLFYLSIVQV